MLPSSQLREITVRDYLIILKRRFWVILACFVVVSVWSTIQTFKKVSLYQASAKVVIERAKPAISPLQQLYPTVYADKDYVAAQVAIIKSRSLAKKAVEYLLASGDTYFAKMKEPEAVFLGGENATLQASGDIINITYTTTDPIRAAKFANALTTVYMQQDVQTKMTTAQMATGWLETELTEMRKKLLASEDALNDYIQKNKIVSVPDLERNSQGSMERLKTQQLELENEIYEMSKRYKAKHPRMIANTSKLQAVKASIEEESRKLLDLNEKMIQYNALKREVQSNRSLYESLLRRAKETEVSKSLETTNIRVIDWAEVPKVPFSPNRKRDMYTGAMFGLLLGFGLAILLEYLDSTVKTAEDIELYVRLPFLGYIPSAKSEEKSFKDVDLASDKAPHSRIAEAYRSIRTSLIFSSPEDRPLKTILVTSAFPQEGKTTVTCNLGIVFAHSNEKVLIVEADMRKPRITKSFGMENKEGLSSYLAGTLNLDNCIKPTHIPNLFLLPSGPKPPNPAELLTSRKPRTLLEELKAKFDRIIIDSPPVLQVTDTSILANMVDGVISVVRANFLNIELILRGRQKLYEAKARIIGVILNNLDVKREDSYYYYHYYYSAEDDQRKKT